MFKCLYLYIIYYLFHQQNPDYRIFVFAMFASHARRLLCEVSEKINVCNIWDGEPDSLTQGGVKTVSQLPSSGGTVFTQSKTVQ